MVRTAFPLVVAAIVAAALSGCVQGGGQTPASTDGGGASVAPPGQYDEATGAVSGLVTDPELAPISAASIGLQGASSLTAISAQDGSFSFSHVAPGSYSILAAKLGYSSSAVRVTVEAGKEASGQRITMAPLPVIQPRATTYIFKGYITCTIGSFAVLSEECGQGLQTPVGTYGTNPNNKIDWKFNLTDTTDMREMFLEMDWTPASAAAQKLDLYVAHNFTCIPSCSAEKTYCGSSNFAPPPARCDIQYKDLGVKATPFAMTSRAWGARTNATELPTIVLEQSFTMYRTEFFGDPRPPGFSAVPDS